MSIKHIFAVAVLLCITSLSAKVAHATNYTGYVGSLLYDNSRTCALFTLQGVTNIDNTGYSWFAIQRTSPFYKETLATILLGKSLT